MSGISQHFIPRFLQKGFRAQGNGKIVRCWVYERGGKVRSSNITKNAAERYFYAAVTEPDLDDKITDREGTVYSPVMDELRAGRAEGVAHLLPELLAHFEIRSRHFRSNMHSAADHITEHLFRQLSDPTVLRTLLAKHFKPGSPVLEGELSKADITYDQLQKILLLKGQTVEQALEPVIDRFATMIPILAAGLRQGMPDVIKKSHVRVLNESISPAVRLARFQQLHYSVQPFEPGNLPLGDSIVLFHVKGDRQYKPYLDKEDELVDVILPLASDQYLIGRAEEGSTMVQSNLPEQIARCSLESFIASTDDERLRELQPLLGANAGWLTPSEMQSVLDDLMTTLFLEARS
ncbi:hypothetical protein [Pseudomonas syringae]|uniref:hypothetical protein n=1 Tax=Pseudomonas syringae TaxID=317 RepID=UPI0004E7AE15|nr:hypothetical protein [Pseudomonas syringae]KFF82154.1 hypothetical protein HM80_16900 [Pseudomonas syringae pv. syringae]